MLQVALTVGFLFTLVSIITKSSTSNKLVIFVLQLILFFDVQACSLYTLLVCSGGCHTYPVMLCLAVPRRNSWYDRLQKVGFHFHSIERKELDWLSKISQKGLQWSPRIPSESLLGPPLIQNCY